MPQLVETFQLCRLKDTTWDDFFARPTLRGKKLRAACRLGPISSAWQSLGESNPSFQVENLTS